jgi:hypothetical protein
MPPTKGATGVAKCAAALLDEVGGLVTVTVGRPPPVPEPPEPPPPPPLPPVVDVEHLPRKVE